MKSIKKFIILILLTLALLACNPEEASAPRRAWIDYPIDGISLIVGEVVSIHSHGYARDGLAEALPTGAMLTPTPAPISTSSTRNGRRRPKAFTRFRSLHLM